jgi:hypothetical protein
LIGDGTGPFPRGGWGVIMGSILLRLDRTVGMGVVARNIPTF